jgi:hypothetical protein
MNLLSKTLQGRHVISIITLFTLSFNAYADWHDFLKIFNGKDSEDTEVISVAKEALGNLSESDLVEGLKEALTRGTHKAVSSLGREDGFLANPKVKIPMPSTLRKVEKGLRKVCQDKIADNFVTAMNRAAEKAVPEAASMFADSVKEMSISDAKEILQGDDDAAAQYFRKNSGAKLKEELLPIVQNATSEVGVISKYKKMIGKLGFLSSYIDTDSLDLDDYVTEKAMDGVFTMVAAEEKKI